MQKLAHPAKPYWLVALILTLLSFSCNQQPPAIGQDFKNPESDTIQAFVVNWLGDTIPSGIPITVKGQYYPADSFPEPAPVKGTSHSIEPYRPILMRLLSRIKPKVRTGAGFFKDCSPPEITGCRYRIPCPLR
jgi:hypothetical protein